MSPTHQHHEVATSQCFVEVGPQTLLPAADGFMLFKYVVRNVAMQFGKSASFLPKPIYGDNGSGLHIHQSLWKDGKPLFYGQGPSVGSFVNSANCEGSEYDGTILHRWSASTCTCIVCIHKSNDKFLQKTSSRF